MHERHSSDLGQPRAPPYVVAGGPVDSHSGGGAAPSGGYTTGFLVFGLALVVVTLFFVQGSSMDMSRVTSSTGQDWSRFISLGGGRSRGGRGGGGVQPLELSSDPQVALIQELTVALEDATSELEYADREYRALRTRMKRFVEVEGAVGQREEVVKEEEGVESMAAPLPPPTALQPPAAAAAASSAAGRSLKGEKLLPAPLAPKVSVAVEEEEEEEESEGETGGEGVGGGKESDPELEEALRSLDPLTPTLPAPPQPCKACFRHGSGLQTRVCLPAPCPHTPSGAARVISTSLYGDNPRYTWGVVRNAELMPAVFPGWHLRVYTRSDMMPPTDIMADLRALGADIVTLGGEEKASGFGMNWRFLVADDGGVDTFLCRDADSRVSLRDRWAAEEWLVGGKEPFHVVRDHPSHSGYKLMGGTWGARSAVFRGPLPPLSKTLGDYVARKGHGDYGADIDFLSEMMWPQMARLGVKQHDTHSCGAGNHGILGYAFPRPRAGTEHVGAVYIYENNAETVRLIDLSLLQGSRGAPDCVPTPIPGSMRRGVSVLEALNEAEPLDPPSFLATASVNDGHALPPPPLPNSHATAWGDEGKGLCSSFSSSSSSSSSTTPQSGGKGRVCAPAVLHWVDAFVDRAIVLSGGGGGGAAGATAYTTVFTYDTHMYVGKVPTTPPPPPPLQYHERVPPTVEPIQALDGGVRYYTSLAVVDPSYGLEGGGSGAAAAAAAAFATHDLPRLLTSALRPETVVLLPQGVAKAVQGKAGEWKEHVVAQEEGENSLYYARHVYVFTCRCS